ncbi:hypothetical protein IW146_007582, partial [Coemansia sp. RSA 922]
MADRPHHRQVKDTDSRDKDMASRDTAALLQDTPSRAPAGHHHHKVRDKDTANRDIAVLRLQDMVGRVPVGHHHRHKVRDMAGHHP